MLLGSIFKHGLRTSLRRRAKLNELKNNPSTRESLAREFSALGIVSGDVVLVHSAFSRIGYVKGGPAAFVSALRDVIGETGTIMMPSFPFNDAMATYVQHAGTFDLQYTPSKSGWLTEHFREASGTLRSLHPTHPFCAQGRHAIQLLLHHDRVIDPLGVDSPVYRLCLAAGKCLLVGTSLRTCTPLSVLESVLPSTYPIWMRDPVYLPVVDQKGDLRTVKTMVHELERATARNPECYRKPLEDRGMLRYGKIGKADTMLVECRDMVPFLSEMHKAGVSPYPAVTAKSMTSVSK